MKYTANTDLIKQYTVEPSANLPAFAVSHIVLCNFLASLSFDRHKTGTSFADISGHDVVNNSLLSGNIALKSAVIYAHAHIANAIHKHNLTDYSFISCIAYTKWS